MLGLIPNRFYGKIQRDQRELPLLDFGNENIYLRARQFDHKLLQHHLTQGEKG
jgi:hypothetical protein